MTRILILIGLLFAVPLFGQLANEDTLCQKGNRFLGLFQYEQALAAYLQCQDSSNSSPTVLLKIAQCQTQLGQWRNAEESYQRVLQYDSTSVVALNQLARLYQKTAQYKKALQQYARLVAQDSSNSFYFKNMGKIAVQLADIPTALSLYETARHYNPADMDVLTQLVRIYQELQLYPKADSLIRNGLAMEPENLKLLQYQVVSAYKQKKYNAVQSSIDHIFALQSDSSAYLLKLLGVSYFHLEKPELAIPILQQVVAKKQDSEIIHYYLGLCYQAQNDFKQSLHHFEQAINRGVSEHLGTYYTNQAIVLEQQGNHGEAIRAFQAAYKSTKDQILLYHLARNYDAYYKNKKTALRYYQRYLEANDTANAAFSDYSEHRITELQKIIHFDLDSLE